MLRTLLYLWHFAEWGKGLHFTVYVSTNSHLASLACVHFKTRNRLQPLLTLCWFPFSLQNPPDSLPLCRFLDFFKCLLLLTSGQIICHCYLVGLSFTSLHLTTSTWILWSYSVYYIDILIYLPKNSYYIFRLLHTIIPQLWLHKTSMGMVRQVTGEMEYFLPYC